MHLSELDVTSYSANYNGSSWTDCGDHMRPYNSTDQPSALHALLPRCTSSTTTPKGANRQVNTRLQGPCQVMESQSTGLRFGRP